MDGPVSSETSQVKPALDSFRWIQEVQPMDVVPEKCVGRVNQKSQCLPSIKQLPVCTNLLIVAALNS